MALIRRESQRQWPQPFERSLFDLFDWPFRPADIWHRLAEDQPNVEEFVEDDELVVRAELPGVDPDQDIDVSITDGNLMIRAERRQEEKVERRNYRRAEIRYGAFARSLPLPPGTKEDDIKATYKDGILEVRAPMGQGALQPSRIPIKRDG